jgi:hypothetical protein
MTLKRISKRTIPALVAALALSAVGVASASAATQHWYAGGIKLAEGTTTSYTMKGTSSFSLKWTNAGAQFAISCTTQKGEGTVLNPLGGGAGTVSPKSFVLSGCTVTRPEGTGCKLKGNELYFYVNDGEATEYESKSAAYFDSASGNEIAIFAFEGCKGSFAFLNGLVQHFNGSLTGVMNKSGALEFTQTSSAITWGAFPASFEGTAKLETTSGASITVAP